jgi:hypothetical protein
MLVAVLVGLAELMVKLQRRDERRKGQKAQPEQGNEQPCGKAILHSLSGIQDRIIGVHLQAPAEPYDMRGIGIGTS